MVQSPAAAPNAVVVALHGDIDISAEPQLKRLASATSSSAIMIVDVADLNFVDTTFLRFLLDLKRQREQTGDVRLVHPSRRIRRLLEITGLVRVFHCYDDLQSASAGLQVVATLAA
jgi:anti-anti-sigma factor